MGHNINNTLAVQREKCNDTVVVEPLSQLLVVVNYDEQLSMVMIFINIIIIIILFSIIVIIKALKSRGYPIPPNICNTNYWITY